MKITKSQLVKIIKEEIESLSEERWEATGNRYSRAPIPGGKTPDEDALKKKHKKLVTPDISKKLDKERARAAKARAKRLAQADNMEEAYGPSVEDYPMYPQGHDLEGLPFLQTAPEEAYEFYAITLKKIAKALGTDATIADALAMIEAGRESGEGSDIPNLEEGK